VGAWAIGFVWPKAERPLSSMNRGKLPLLEMWAQGRTVRVYLTMSDGSRNAAMACLRQSFTYLHGHKIGEFSMTLEGMVGCILW